jgi:predicted HicB family RNase H-like nuclease
MKEKEGRTIRFSLRVPPTWHAAVKVEARRLGISMADLVIMVLNERLGAAGKGRDGRKN